jgi:hypothetical protein
MKEKQDQQLADILFPTDEQIELTESILDIPAEQRRLHTESYDFTVSTLVSYLKEKKLTIPEFQRRYVWSDAQASRLIESLIIQCPIPVIYLSQQKDESLAVIDDLSTMGKTNGSWEKQRGRESFLIVCPENLFSYPTSHRCFLRPTHAPQFYS